MLAHSDRVSDGVEGVVSELNIVVGLPDPGSGVAYEGLNHGF